MRENSLSGWKLGFIALTVIALAAVLFMVETNRSNDTLANAASISGTTGDTGDTSSTKPKLTIKKIDRNKKKGTAKISGSVNKSGKVSLKGNGVAKDSQKKSDAGNFKLDVKATGKKKKTLKKKGKVSVKVTITFNPDKGNNVSAKRSITLIDK